MTALALVVGNAIGGARGLLYAGIFVVVMNVASFWFSDRIALAMHRARPLEEAQLPWLFGIVRELAGRYRMPMPRVYLIPTSAPNAFATGRSPEHAAVAVTQGILQLCDERERGHPRQEDSRLPVVPQPLAAASLQGRGHPAAAHRSGHGHGENVTSRAGASTRSRSL
jgi:heat shock protein HtpX